MTDEQLPPEVPHEDHVCAVCRVALDYHQVGGEGKWIHPYAVEKYVVGVAGHEPQPVLAAAFDESGRYRCDFCFAPAPVWRYPCKSFMVDPEGKNDNTDYVSVEDWAACDQCKALIDRRDVGKLVQRAMSMGPSTYSRAHDPRVGKEVKRRLRKLYAKFFAGITGPATTIRSNHV